MSQKKNYMIQLDGLRFFAVAGVVWHHWAPKELHFGIPWSAGVFLFFVLSGFLITGILLKSKEASENQKITKLFTWKQFYIRRFLRIFPLYYFVLLASFLFHVEQDTKPFLWHVSYMSNYHFYQIGYFNSFLSHFWTLAVEEQFYLFWPFLILLIPKKYLMPVFFLIILISPLHKISMGPDYYNSGVYGILTIDCLDYLGMGALLALLKSNLSESQILSFLKRYKRLIGWSAGISLLILLLLMMVGIWNYVLMGIQGTIVSIVFAFLVSGASNGFKGIAGKILEFQPFVYLGKISYGIYVYHVFAMFFVPKIFDLFSLRHLIKNSIPLYLVSMTVWTIIITSASWYFFEKPINNLKKRFPYY